MEKKITKAQKFEMLKAIPAVAENALLIEFIEHELSLLERKNDERKSSAQKDLDNAICEAIVAYLSAEPNRLFTITEINKNVAECVDLSGQKVSSLVRSMLGKQIERIEEKRRAYFRYLAE